MDSIELLVKYGELDLIEEGNSYQYMLHASYGHPRPVCCGARSINKSDALKYLFRQVESSIFMTCNAIEKDRG